eukprot:3897519-Rhodomonas_salina.1
MLWIDWEGVEASSDGAVLRAAPREPAEATDEEEEGEEGEEGKKVEGEEGVKEGVEEQGGLPMMMIAAGGGGGAALCVLVFCLYRRCKFGGKDCRVCTPPYLLLFLLCVVSVPCDAMSGHEPDMRYDTHIHYILCFSFSHAADPRSAASRSFPKSSGSPKTQTTARGTNTDSSFVSPSSFALRDMLLKSRFCLVLT